MHGVPRRPQCVGEGDDTGGEALDVVEEQYLGHGSTVGEDPDGPRPQRAGVRSETWLLAPSRRSAPTTSGACCDRRPAGRAGQHGAGQLDDDGLRDVEDAAIRDVVALQRDAGLRTATDGEFRRTSWHMDFIYQLEGVDPTDQKLAVHFHNEEGDLDFEAAALQRPRAGSASGTRSSATPSRSCGDWPTTAVPKLTIPSPSMVHYRGGRAAIDASVYPDLEQFWDDLTAAYAEQVRRVAELGCTYLQLDDTSLAYLNDPEQRALVASQGGDPDHQHEHYIAQMNAAIAGRPDGLRVTTHMCRGNFRSSWAAEGGYDFVAEALFSELDVDGFFLEYDDERSGGFEPLRFVPAGQAGRARPRHHQERRAGGQGRPQAPHRRGRQVRAARPALPVPAVRLLLHRRGQRADLRRAGRPSCAWSSRPPRKSGGRAMGLLEGAPWEGRLLKGGQWTEGRGGTYAVVEPATGNELGTMGRADAEDVAEAAASAAEAQREWAALPHTVRAAVLRRAGDLWAEHADEIRDWNVREVGAIPPMADFAMHVAAEECYQAAALPGSPIGQVLPSEQPRLSMAASGAGRRGRGDLPVQRPDHPGHPVGRPGARARQRGAPEAGPAHRGHRRPVMARIFEEAGLPPGVLQMLPGGEDVGQAMVTDPHVRVISFTGSTAVGRAIGELAGRHLKRAHPERRASSRPRQREQPRHESQQCGLTSAGRAARISSPPPGHQRHLNFSATSCAAARPLLD